MMNVRDLRSVPYGRGSVEKAVWFSVERLHLQPTPSHERRKTERQSPQRAPLVKR